MPVAVETARDECCCMKRAGDVIECFIMKRPPTTALDTRTDIQEPG
jgi:hypothetical protein